MLTKTNVQSFKKVGEKKKSIMLLTAYIQYWRFPDFLDK